MKPSALLAFSLLCACDDPEPTDPPVVDEPVFVGEYLAAEASVRLYSTEAQQHAGRVVVVGDLDGDDVDELVVTTVRDDDYEGGAWVMHDLPDGAGTFPDHGTRLEGDARTRGAGRSASIGDADGDGRGDLLISAPYPGSNALLLLHGPIDGPVQLGDISRRFVGDEGDTTGHKAHLVDMNGDGLADIVSGAPGRFGSPDRGAVMLVYAPFSDDTTRLGTESDAVVRGGVSGDGVGRTLAAGGDVDGDGVPDMLVGGPYADREGKDRGVVSLALGPFAGEVDLADAQAELRGQGPDELAGMDLAMGDVDGDGLADLVVGARTRAGILDGVVYVVTSTPEGVYDLGDAEITVRGESGGWALGWAVAAQDMDADGRAELLLGALGAHSTGVAYLFDDAQAGSWTTADADAWVRGETGGASTGMGVAFGDLDGDGVRDLIVGAPMEDRAGENGGAVYALLSGGG